MICSPGLNIKHIMKKPPFGGFLLLHGCLLEYPERGLLVHVLIVFSFGDHAVVDFDNVDNLEVTQVCMRLIMHDFMDSADVPLVTTKATAAREKHHLFGAHILCNIHRNFIPVFTNTRNHDCAVIEQTLR